MSNAAARAHCCPAGRFTARRAVVAGRAVQARPLRNVRSPTMSSTTGSRSAAPALSDDGQWLSYSVTSQAEDGELIVRNLKTSQEFKHPRGTGAQFTADGKFVIFTIAQSKADEERERLANRGRGAAAARAARHRPPAHDTAGNPGATRDASRDRGGAGRTPGRWRTAGRRQRGARHAPRTGLGIMSLADGKVTTVDRVGSFKLADENPDLAGLLQGNRRRWRRCRRRPRRRTRCGCTTGSTSGRCRPRRGRRANARERKQPGSDLILRNMATGEETTIAEVTEYFWNQKGTLLAYAVSSNDAAKDGAFAAHDERRHRHDAALRQGPLPQPRVRRSRHADHLPQRPGRVRQAGRAVSRLLLEDRRRQGDRARVGGDGRHGEGHGRCRQRGAALLARRRAHLPRDRAAAAAAAAPTGETHRRRPTPIPVDLWSSKDPLDPADAARPRRRRSASATTARSITSPTRSSSSSRRRTCRPSIPATISPARSA